MKIRAAKEHALVEAMDGATDMTGECIGNIFLDKCSHCGYNKPTMADVSYDDDLERWYEVCCDATNGGCGARGGCADTMMGAVQKWNRRAELVNNKVDLEVRFYNELAQLSNKFENWSFQMEDMFKQTLKMVDKRLQILESTIKTEAVGNVCRSADWIVKKMGLVIKIGFSPVSRRTLATIIEMNASSPFWGTKLVGLEINTECAEDDFMTVKEGQRIVLKKLFALIASAHMNVAARDRRRRKSVLEELKKCLK